jgi:crotonobetainyl-CoA:carnitine CoA-transferase CaiB-like acyl-CoA transferase
MNGTFVAVPHCGSLLAQLGAEVTKIEPPGGDPFRPQGYGVNRGVRSLSIDLKSPTGQAAFYRVVAGADAVIDGLRPGVAEQLNVDYASLAGVNAEIVTTSVSAFGEGGALSHKGGVDMVIQGMSGMMTAQGGADDPVINTIAIVDMATGALSALATTLGLLHKVRTGRGQRTWVALAATAAYLQAGELTSFRDAPPPVVGGQDFKGPDPYHRIYRVADGWIRIDAGPGCDAGAAIVRARIGLETQPSGGDAVSSIAQALAEIDRRAAVTALNGAGLATVEVRTVSAVIRDPRLVLEEFLHVTSAPGSGLIAAPGRPAGFSRSARFGPLLPPGIGEHSTETLLSAGLSEPEIRSLIADGVVRQGSALIGTLAPTYR